VAGNFVVNGSTEAATGNGQQLSGNSGNKNTDGLMVRATGSTTTSAGISVTQGLASRLSGVLSKYLDASTGRFKSIGDNLKSQTDEIDKTIARQNTALTLRTDDLKAQFAGMEAAVSRLKGLQTQLSTLTTTSSSSK
jgi:flagellar hook-associated protein 2